uniref:Uncharacterized protein n=1 Tax=Canis lupus familiaris TaxID=9615 RepID=A0A8C0T6Z2_CANLF
MPKYCRAPNCSNTAGRLGADNRPVMVERLPLAQGRILESWDPVPHQAPCREPASPLSACVSAFLSVLTLMPLIPCLFFQRQQSSRSTEKPVESPSSPEAMPLSPDPTVSASGPMHLAVLGSASGGPEATATMFLTSLPPPPAPARPQPGVQAQNSLAGLGSVLGALQKRTPGPSLGSHSSQNPIICGGPDIAVVIAQRPTPPTLDAKPELLDTETPSAKDQDR